jgi:hypothetical protein
MGLWGQPPERPPVHDGKEVGMRRMIAAIAVVTAALTMAVPGRRRVRPPS